jgi:hypothetical protein
MKRINRYMVVFEMRLENSQYNTSASTHDKDMTDNSMTVKYHACVLCREHSAGG